MAFYRFFCWLPKQFWDACQTCQHLPKAILEKNLTCLAKFARVMRELSEWWARGHCLVFIKWKIEV
jgi:hypothetical protein